MIKREASAMLDTSVRKRLKFDEKKEKNREYCQKMPNIVNKQRN